MCRYSGWMNDVWQELLGEKKIDIISERCTRVVIQRVDIEISKDKDLFVRHSWIRQNFLQIFTEGIKGCAWMMIGASYHKLSIIIIIIIIIMIIIIIIINNYFDIKEANFFFALFGSKFDASMKAL